MELSDVLGMFIVFVFILLLIVGVVCGTISCLSQTKANSLITDNYMEKVAIDDDTKFRYYRDTVTDYIYLAIGEDYELITNEDGSPMLYAEWLKMQEVQ